MTTPFPQQPPVPPPYGQPVQPVQPPVPQGYQQPVQPPRASGFLPATSKERKTYATVLVVIGVVLIGVGTAALKGNDGDTVKVVGFVIGAAASLLWSSAKKLEKEEQAAQPPMTYGYPQGYVHPAQFAAQPPQYPYPMVQQMPPQGFAYPPQGVPANPQQTVQPPVTDPNGEVK